MTASTNKRRLRTTGFTLVELMVAMAIGLFMVIGLISLLVSISGSRTELDKTSVQIENGRYALQVLLEDVAHAGYLGTFDPTGVSYTSPDPCAPSAADFDPATLKVPVAVYGYDGPTADATPPSCVTNREPGTGVLVVRRVATTTTAVGAITAGETYLQNNACPPIASGKSFVVSTAAADFTLLQKDCTTAGLLNKYMVHVYYVSSCDTCTPTSDLIPTLKMAEFANGAMTVTPLAEGIQNLQIDYGIDVDGDGAPDCYVSNPSSTSTPAVDPNLCPDPTAGGYVWSNAVTNWGNVMTARIYVLARNNALSADWTDTRTYDMGLAGAAGPFNDQVKRHVYNAVARLTNVSGRRDTP